MHSPTLEAIDHKAHSEIEPVDLKMMQRCIELSGIAGREGEFPFASVIARNGKIIAEATNRVVRDRDVTRHAELLAITEGQRVLGKGKLKDCTLYSNIEPCVMCSFPIREARVARVVFSLKSPLMGGFSRWNVLGDEVILSKMREVFGEVPEIVEGVLEYEADQIWRAWNPIIWKLIQRRGCFSAPQGFCLHHKTQLRGNLFRSFMSALHKYSRSR
jgi:tRNA(adenine34) deaminase